LVYQSITWFNPESYGAGPDAVMKPEFPRIDQERAVSPHAQEIEYALLLQRMINAVKDDPAQMRLTIYEFARARLKIDTSWNEEGERRRLSASLETAIQGVEEFCARREEKERLPPPAPQTQIAHVGPPTAPPAAPAPARSPPPLATFQPVNPAPNDILLPNRSAYLRASEEPVVEVRTRALVSTLTRLCIGMLLFVVVVSLAYYKQRLPVWRDQLAQLATSKLAKPGPAAVPDAQQPGAASPDAKPVVAASNAPSFPVPSDYGVYALSNNALNELYLLPERVPDKRIAVSTPIDKPSRTTLADGKAKFIIFRRDLVGNAPDRIEIRVVARVVRALTFDAKGKPAISPVSDAWNIRNVSYEFRVRPIAGNPEMLLVQPDKPDFALPAGRYALVLRDQAYDFVVGGKITDLTHCLERTDAANGTFYSECLKL
jgi:hypothetical protein